MSFDVITREEQYLNRLAGETEQEIPEPETRKEQYLSRLCGADNIIPQEPITREEQYLASLCGEEVEMPEPETRLEQYMAFAGGERENKPEPITRKEQLWDKYQGGEVPEEKTVTGTVIHVTDAIEAPAVSLKVTIEPKQAGTPFVGDTTTEPYLSKTATTTGNKRYLDKIVGGTVVWNQLVDTNTTSVTVLTGHKYIAKINGTWTLGNGGTVSVTGGTDMLIDLTLMFGSSIADYIYTLEQAETGAGVQWLKDYGFIDDNYRAYNPGELISTRIEGIRYGNTTHAFGSPVTLRGLYRLSATTHKLYCTGDELPPDGTRTTNWSSYDLGTRTWNATSTYFWCDISSKKNGLTNLICSKYLTSSGGEDKTIKGFSTTSRIAIYDSSYSLSDVAAFKTAMSGVYVLVERETPTTSTSETYPNPVDIESGDIESFIDTRSIPLPVGNNSHYAGEYAVQGKTGLTVNHAQTQADTPTTYSVIFTEQGTVYGGTVDIVTGALSITWGYIASYNGETLTGRWLSSMDVYAEGTTPTTGAEVAYELASPITATLTPTEVQMLLGENYISNDVDGQMELTYLSKAAQRVLAMNSKLNLNKQALEIKRNGGVIIDKPIIKPIGGGAKL